MLPFQKQMPDRNFQGTASGYYNNIVTSPSKQRCALVAFQAEAASASMPVVESVKLNANAISFISSWMRLTQKMLD